MTMLAGIVVAVMAASGPVPDDATAVKNPAPPAAERGELVTDRPDFTESSLVVGKGIWQLGAAGMGFAVVAEEVRSLAQRSADAARDTAALIETSVDKTRQGSERTEHVAQAVRGIAGSVSRVRELITSINDASAQQSHGISQTAQAIQQMEQVTQRRAASAEEAAAASEQLARDVDTSRDVVRELEQLVGQNDGRTASRGRNAKPGPVALKRAA